MPVENTTTIPPEELNPKNLDESAIFLGKEFAKVNGSNTTETIKKLCHRVGELAPEDAYQLLTRISRIVLHKKGIGDPSV